MYHLFEFIRIAWNFYLLDKELTRADNIEGIPFYRRRRIIKERSNVRVTLFKNIKYLLPLRKRRVIIDIKFLQWLYRGFFDTLRFSRGSALL